MPDIETVNLSQLRRFQFVSISDFLYILYKIKYSNQKYLKHPINARQDWKP